MDGWKEDGVSVRRWRARARPRVAGLVASAGGACRMGHFGRLVLFLRLHPADGATRKRTAS